ncbi:MAG TPA: aldo/keto reductase [Gaiellaceae bacterium]|jgi:aryl-alcohol dehydrogenase-like predicted oxidoreductase|nr:aldo/keto reductase [Gaiellaceae bacterium]
MDTRALGQLEVSVVGLGCNNFGGRIDEAATRAVVDAALEAGVTFFDTADIYGNQGGSELLLGRALGARRDGIVLATKFGKPMGDGEERRGSPAYVVTAVEASLRRLQTDRIDLLQHHEMDPGTPVEETVGAVAALVQAGKVRAYGTSNYSPEQMRETARVAEALGVPYVSEQGHYSWLARDAERELLPACAELGLGFIPYFPLANGLLTGKVRRGRPPAEGTRLHGREISDAQLDEVERLAAWGDAHGVSLLEIAIGGLLAEATIPSVIAGATKPEQVRANVAASAWRPSRADLAELRGG